MYFVYVLESSHQKHWYFGITNNLKRRLDEHNNGKSIHTNKYKPWKLRFCATFDERIDAVELERYLKSHSGRIWMKKHLDSK